MATGSPRILQVCVNVCLKVAALHFLSSDAQAVQCANLFEFKKPNCTILGPSIGGDNDKCSNAKTHNKGRHVGRRKPSSSSFCFQIVDSGGRITGKYHLMKILQRIYVITQKIQVSHTDILGIGYHSKNFLLVPLQYFKIGVAVYMP